MKKSTSLAMAMGWVFSISVAGSAYAQTVEIGTWAGFRTAAVSFTFDDGAPSHVTDVGPLFDNYGFKATFNLVTNWNPNWTGFQGMASNGHEIASHSDNHGNPMPNNEIASSKATINDNIKNNECITLAYPNCTVPDEATVLQNYIAGRICGNGSEVMGKDGPSNWAQVPAIMTGVEQQYSINFNSVNQFTGKMQEASQKGGWVMFLTHGLAGKSNNGNATFSPTDLSVIDGALSWASTNDIWVGTFRDVAMYIKERKASKATASTSGNSITVKLTHSIADNISKYNYPLSLRVKNSSNWTAASGTQGGKAITVTIKDGYIYFDAVPNGGDIVISSGGSSTPTSSSATEPSSSNSNTGVFAEYKIEMEDYMQGGEDVAYGGVSGDNGNTGYREDDAGVVTAETGYAIGYTQANEWLKYSVDITCAGQYKVVARAGTGSSKANQFTVTDGSENTVTFKISNPGSSWDNWDYEEIEGSGTVSFSQGTQTFTLTFVDNYTNVDWIKFTSDNAQCPDAIPVAKDVRWNSFTGPVQYQVFDMNGHLLKSATVSAQGGVQGLWQGVSAGLPKGMYVLRYGKGGSMRSVQVRK